MKEPPLSVHMLAMKKLPWARPRSPFAGFSRSDLQMLRALTVAVLAWEKAAREGNFHWLPYAHEILQNDGGSFQANLLHDIQEKAWNRLHALPQWQDIFDTYRLARMRRFDSRAYEVRKLREEIAHHVASCRCAA